jgi:hypothetical protein
MLLTTFLVTNYVDDGPGSLGWAIGQANADPLINGADYILFTAAMPPPGGPIHVREGEPPVIRDYVYIEGGVTLDGTGGCCDRVLELDGYDDGIAGPITILNFDGAGVWLRGNSDFVTGVAIRGVAGDGVDVMGDNDSLSADAITGNGGNGVSVTGDGNSIGFPPGNPLGTDDGGNWLAGNGQDGVTIWAGASGNVVQNNLIGTDYSGTGAYPNAWSGVAINDSPGNTIGGSVAGTGNVISGNGTDGISIGGSGSTNEVIQGNKVGTDSSGTLPLGNGNRGIGIYNVSGNLIGGTEPGAGNTIDDNVWEGIAIYGSANNLVEGNRIGTDITGLRAIGNHLNGVGIWGGSTGNTIGGAASGAGNLICGNGINYGGGIAIADPGTSGNVVQGNLIGVVPGNLFGPDVLGESPLENLGSGVAVSNGASDNTIGGPDPGAGNVVAANGGDGVSLGDAGTTGNVVQGNLIGTDSSGTFALGNGNRGVGIYGGASGNLVGGTASGAGNTIADNAWEGVAIIGSSGNVVEGNRIGTDVTGLKPLGNRLDGVAMWGGSTSNTIGGPAAGAGNLISGNNATYGYAGVGISDVGTSGNVVQGNLIGTDATGRAPLGNLWDGIGITGGASNNTIGGPDPGDGNVISANGAAGIDLSWSTSGNAVQGNRIGTDMTGTLPLGNAADGIAIWSRASGNLIGGPDPGDGNIISANGSDGVEIADPGTSGNVVQRNFIGVDATGTVPMGNQQDGVEIRNGATDNLIGDTSTAGLNVISANLLDGIAIEDSGTSDNEVEWDFIGTDITGTQPLGNAGDGVAIAGGASSNFIGLPSPGVGNVISANLLLGVLITDAGTTDNVVAHNFIGTDLTGTAALGNLQGGVAILNDASENLIGTTDETGGNIISGNGFDGDNGSYSGIAIAGDETDDNLVQHNIIGLAAGGKSALPNAQDGVDLFGGADGNTIGGTEHHTENLISGNIGAGVVISDFATNRNVIEGNLIGTDLDGNSALPNGSDGVQLVNTHSNTVGGGSTPESRNIIAGNAGSGVVLIGAAGNTVAGNSIGVGLGGSALGNLGFGVYLGGASSFNVVGGTDPNSTNLIGANDLAGVAIDGTGSDDNVVQGDLIGTDGGGTAGLGNAAEGVLVADGASDNTIGGTVAGAGNVIAFNGGNGVTVGVSATDDCTGDAILGNSIDSNARLGLDLADDGVTPDDSQGHSGPNLFQDFPVITAATTIGSTTTITGTVSGPANSTLRVELFSNPAADASGYGQGQVFLGYITVTTGVDGGAFTFTTSTPVPVGQVVTATATDVNGNTSEFAQDAPVTANAPLDIGFRVSGPLYNPIHHTYTELATLTNDGTSTVDGFEFVLERLSPGVTLTDASGTTADGSPYILIGRLKTHQSVTLRLTFTKSSPSPFIDYTPEFIPVT